MCVTQPPFWLHYYLFKVVCLPLKCLRVSKWITAVERLMPRRVISDVSFFDAIMRGAKMCSVPYETVQGQIRPVSNMVN